MPHGWPLSGPLRLFEAQKPSFAFRNALGMAFYALGYWPLDGPAGTRVFVAMPLATSRCLPRDGLSFVRRLRADESGPADA